MTHNSVSGGLNDTVADAVASPDLEQPYAALGLKDDEYARIKEILGRRPTDAELAMYSVMWSEHCSYKSSKTHLRYFGKTTTEEMGSKILAGIGENAGGCRWRPCGDFPCGVPQSPLLCGASSGCCDGCGRYCPRHYGYGRASYRCDGPVAFRARRCPRYAACAAGCG